MSAFYNKITNLSSNLLLKHLPLFQAVYKLLDYLPSSNNYANVYVDVSVFAKVDNQTGIQRVVREVIIEMLRHPLLAQNIKFVIATKKTPYHIIPFTFNDNQIQFELNKDQVSLLPVDLAKGDVFIGLDFCPNIVPSHIIEFLKWRTKGATLSWVVYDLLPLHNPEWFPDNTQSNFEPWLKTVLLTANRLFAISNEVVGDIQWYAEKNLHIILPHYSVQKIPLGHNFSAKINPYKSSPKISIIRTLLDKKFILMVGTIEPRKGHVDILATFNQLAALQANGFILVIAGKRGWKTETIIDKIQQDDRVVWLEGIDDYELIWLYERCQGVIIASYNEGFGLPLLEAISFNKYILARDIPIFREVSSEYKNIDFFLSNNSDLVQAFNHWLIKISQGSPIHNTYNLENYNWQNTVNTIIHAFDN